MPRKGEVKNGKIWDGKRWIWLEQHYTARAAPRSASIPQLTGDESWEELKQLRSTVDRQRDRIEFYGGTVPEEGQEKDKSIVSRLFDVVSRPNYAVANAVKSLVDDDNSGNIFSAAARGLSGKDKTTFSDVLEEADMPGGWQRTALGFALDVVADPTTHVGLGVLGKADDILKLSARANQKAAKFIKAEKALARAGKSHVAKRAVQEAMSAVPAQKRMLLNTDEIIDEAISKEAFRLAKEEEAKLLSRTGPKFGIKVFGTGKGIGSERLYRTLDSIKAGIVENTPLRNLSPKTLFPSGINQTRLQHFGASAIKTKAELDGWRHLLKKHGLNAKWEREDLLRRIKNGDTIPPDLQPVADEYRALMREIAQDEIELFGNSKLAKELADNSDNGLTYVPNLYRKGHHLRTFDNPALARKHGYKEVTDIQDVITYKVDKHNRELGRYNLAQDLIKNFGVRVSSGKTGKVQQALIDSKQLTNSVKDKYVPKSVYFEPKVADAINKLNEFFENDEAMRSFWRTFDNVHGQWKFLATVPNPGFHMRNLMSDTWTNFMDGMDFRHARIYKASWDWTLGAALRGGKRPKNHTFKIGNSEMGVDEILAKFDSKGLNSGFYRAEAGKLTPDALSSQVGTGVMRYARNASEGRENWMRLSHFIYAAQRAAKQGKKGEEIWEDAADVVRTFNFDYNDFTPFEAKVMKRIIPFYSWMRKNIPLQLSLMATRPGRIALAPKSLRAIQELLGIDPGEEPMPGLGNIIPQWMDEMGSFLVRPGSLGEAGPLMFTPNFLPMIDAAQYAEGIDQALTEGRLAPLMQPMEQLVSGISPFVRTPFELAAGREVFGQRDIKDIPGYLMRQFIPPKRYTTDVVKEDPNRSITQRAMNTWLGLNLREVEPYQMQSELRRQQDRYDSQIGPLKERAYQEWLRKHGYVR